MSEWSDPSTPRAALPEEATPDRKSVSFTLEGDRLAPDPITAALGLTPTRAHRKGEVRPDRQGLRFRSGQWTLVSMVSPLTRSRIATHFAQLLDQLEPKAETVHRLCADQELTAYFSCGYHMHTSNTGFGLSLTTLRRIAALGASLGFDIYDPSWDDPLGVI